MERGDEDEREWWEVVSVSNDRSIERRLAGGSGEKWETVGARRLTVTHYDTEYSGDAVPDAKDRQRRQMRKRDR